MLFACGFLPTARAQAKNSPPQVLPEIVRLSLVDGDVRIMRGEDGKKVSGAEWQQAAADTPIEGGFSLVTGAGRAEIEFEDASVAYLAPNSVLMFDELAAQNGIPSSRMQLLSGTMTMRMRPEFPGESYVIATPQGIVRAGYPRAAFFRVTSYLDATLITPLDEETRKVHPGRDVDLAPGESLLLHNGHSAPAPPADVSGQPDTTAFDTWVTARLQMRDKVMAAMEQEAGLLVPIPGLADMQGQGTFFDCEPYGRCWRPNDGWRHAEQTQQPSPAVSEIEHATAPRFLEAALQLNVPRSFSLTAAPLNAQQQMGPQSLTVEDVEYFPCDPFAMRYWYRRDPATGAMRVMHVARVASPYDWTVCHTGSWIVRNRRYAWVSGSRRHHLCPVHWLKNGGREGFVPVHPKDQPGKPPLNLRFGLYETKGWKHGDVARVDYDPGKAVKVLSQPPKGFDEVPLPRLAPVGEPKMEAHELLASSGTKNLGHGDVLARPAGPVNIRFNSRTENFSLAHMEMHGGRMTTVSRSFSGASQGVGVSSVSRGGFSSGGVHSSGGGGARAGGGSAGSSGGSHGGGVSSGGGASSGGGGAHH